MPRRLRVGLDLSSAIDPRPSGVARYICGLVEGIEAADSWDLVLFCRSSRWRRGDPSAHFSERPIRRWFDWQTPREVDVFHAPDLRPPRKIPPSLVVTIHDLSALDRTDHARPKFIAKKRAQLERVTGGTAHVITHTETMRRELIERTSLDAGRVSAVPLWAGLPAAATPEELEISRTRTLLLVGGPSRRKGSERILPFLRDFQAANPSDERWSIDWCGSASAQEIDAFAATLPDEIRARIRWHGHVSDRELDRLLRTAGAFLQLSQTEGFGIPLLESAERSCPVLVAECPTAKEVLPEECAFYWSEDRASLKAFFRDEERTRRVRRAREHAAHFTLERTIAETMNVYEQTLRAAKSFKNFPRSTLPSPAE